MFAVLVLVAVIGFLLLKDGRVGPLSWDGPRCRRPEHAERLLAERLATGDISPDDYEARLAALRTS